MLLTWLWGVLSLNLCQDTNYPEGDCGLPHSFRDSTLRPLPLSFFPVHYLLSPNHNDVIQPDLLTVSLNYWIWASVACSLELLFCKCSHFRFISWLLFCETWYVHLSCSSIGFIVCLSAQGSLSRDMLCNAVAERWLVTLSSSDVSSVLSSSSSTPWTKSPFLTFEKHHLDSL
jgi:hypothetical protein